jgi:hypothetical protein
MDVDFLIGSPRPCTTILENFLNVHASRPKLQGPYSLWERYLNANDSDLWDQNHSQGHIK